MQVVQDQQVFGKTFLVRVDYNVPLKNGTVSDLSKVLASLPTLAFLLEQQCKIILCTHLGRPKGKVVPSLRVAPLVRAVQNLLPGIKIHSAPDCIGKRTREIILEAQNGEIIFLENVRFYKEEEQNNAAFAHSLAYLADYYVNEAFSNSHNAHASMEAITHFLPAVSGLQLQQELIHLNQALKPKKPAVWILGGGKLNKIVLLEQALDRADKVLLGGALPFAFMKAQRIPVGMSKVDAEAVRRAQYILKKRKSKKLLFPLDYIVTNKVTGRSSGHVVHFNRIEREDIAVDIGPSTVEFFQKQLKSAKTIVWNGPLGCFEYSQFAGGTRDIGRFLTTLPATTICGGGETAAAVHKFHLEQKITHVSTGGGASVAYLSGKKLPGLIALERNEKRFKLK